MRLPLTVLFLSLGLALAFWASPGAALADGDARAGRPARFFDAQVFTEELSEGGSLKFYDATEELLRAGQFERALLRYQFLRAQIGRQAGYRPLTVQVDQRLHFLKSQLKLGDGALASLPLSIKPKAARPEPAAKAAAPSPPPPPKAAGDDSAAEPPKAALTPAGGVPLPDKRHGVAAGPDTPESKDQAAEERPPPPPLSRWEKVKRRSMFWKKKEV